MPNRIHIFHVFSTFGVGGPQVRTCTILNSLGPGFRHTITATDGRFEAAGNLSSSVEFQLLPPPPGKGSMFYALPFARVLRELRPDLLLTYNWGAFDAIWAAQVESLCPVIHAEDGFGADEAHGLKWRRVWSRRLLLNHVFRVVVPSRVLLNVALRQYGVRPGLIDWIPNGVEAEEAGICPSERRRLRRELGAGDDTLLAGYIGRLSEEKNLPLLLGAFARTGFPNARLAVVGDGPSRPELEALVRSMNLERQVVFMGFVPRPRPIFQALDLFAMSSTTEQMPVALLEAMAAGLPAICTDVGDSAEILGNPGWPATVPAGDCEAYSRGLVSFFEDSHLRQQLGERNRVRCLEVYSLRQMIARYRDLYLAAIGNEGLRPPKRNETFSG